MQSLQSQTVNNSFHTSSTLEYTLCSSVDKLFLLLAHTLLLLHLQELVAFHIEVQKKTTHVIMFRGIKSNKESSRVSIGNLRQSANECIVSMSSHVFPSQLQSRTNVPKIHIFNHFICPHHHGSELFTSVLKPNAKNQKANQIQVIECLLLYQSLLNLSVPGTTPDVLEV